MAKKLKKLKSVRKLKTRETARQRARAKQQREQLRRRLTAEQKARNKELARLGKAPLPIPKTTPIKKSPIKFKKIKSIKSVSGRPKKRKPTPKPVPKDREISVISRRGQPQARITIPISKAPVGIATAGGPVSSSWIASLRWDTGLKAAFMRTLDTRYGPYKVDITWRLFEEWVYAQSKGTFFNQKIKGKHTVTIW